MGLWLVAAFPCTSRHMAVAPARLRKGPWGANCVGTIGMCTRSALNMIPKLASDLQIPWHNLAHFCCATFCHFLILPVASPPPPRRPAVHIVCGWVTKWDARCLRVCVLGSPR